MNSNVSETETLWMENVTYDELSVGQSARLLRTVTLEDIQAFAAVSGDINPAHLNPEYADATMFHGVIAHGMLGAALISALFGTQFPGPGTIYLGQELKFTKPVRIGDTLTVLATEQLAQTKLRIHLPGNRRLLQQVQTLLERIYRNLNN